MSSDNIISRNTLRYLGIYLEYGLVVHNVNYVVMLNFLIDEVGLYNLSSITPEEVKVIIDDRYTV